jgi:hypothetical protein
MSCEVVTAPHSSPPKVRRRADVSCPTRTELHGITERASSVVERDFTTVYRRQRALLAAGAEFFALAKRDRDGVLRRTVPQIIHAKAFQRLGWEDQGSVKANRSFYRNRIARMLDKLKEIGWVADWRGVTRDDGEGLWFEVEFTKLGLQRLADVAQLARAPLS